MNQTSVAVSVDAHPAGMTAADMALPVKSAAKETVEGILYGSVRRLHSLGTPSSPRIIR